MKENKAGSLIWAEHQLVDILQPVAELQKRADRADQSVLFFLAGANFWEKHAKNC